MADDTQRQIKRLEAQVLALRILVTSLLRDAERRGIREAIIDEIKRDVAMARGVGEEVATSAQTVILDLLDAARSDLAQVARSDRGDSD